MSKKDKEKRIWDLKILRERNRKEFLFNIRVIIIGGFVLGIVYLLTYLQLHFGVIQAR